ncbi:MAG: hypothetical protein NZ808_10685 [Myxococcota bacterium]|nr:hypothetical protein [Myxococcota bacterium]
MKQLISPMAAVVAWMSEGARVLQRARAYDKEEPRSLADFRRDAPGPFLA